MNDNKWTEVKPFEYTASDLDGKVFSCKNCYDDNNSIYQFSGYNLSKYDLMKNEWTLICKNEDEDQ